MSKYNAAYINALSEERDTKVLFEWVYSLHHENVDLREKIKELEDELHIKKQLLRVGAHWGD